MTKTSPKSRRVTADVRDFRARDRAEEPDGCPGGGPSEYSRYWEIASAAELALVVAAAGEAAVPAITNRARRLAEARAYASAEERRNGARAEKRARERRHWGQVMRWRVEQFERMESQRARAAWAKRKAKKVA